MKALSEKQFEILNHHTRSRLWSFASFEKGYFNFVVRPWLFAGFGEENYEYTLSISFIPEKISEIGPLIRLEEISSKTSMIYLNTPINWVEREVPDHLIRFWDWDYWYFFHDRVRPAMRHRVASVVQYGLCKPPIQLSCGMVVSAPGPTLGQLVKLASLATRKEMMNVRACGEKVVNEFLNVFKEMDISLDPKFYHDGKSQ